jgi:arylsulfatase A-like enzyme
MRKTKIASSPAPMSKDCAWNPAPRRDCHIAVGLRLLSMNVETQCTPSRSSLMTGRSAVRSGT